MKLPVFIQKIIEEITLAGFEAFVVGGCIRDLLLKKTPCDWDIASSATPSDIIKIFSEHRTIPTGIKHGTVTVLSENGPVEITTYRIDGEYHDFRRPVEVTFSGNISDDLSRRDFTVNAMAYNPQIGFIDLFDGHRDLANKTIRCVGQAEVRFREDALRIMRALRFAAVLGFDIEASTSSACFECRHLLENIAKERIAAELSKLIMADNPFDILVKYSSIFADIFDFDIKKNANRWEANAKALCRAEKNLPLRLSLLLDGFDHYKILKALKFDNKTLSAVKTINKYIDVDFFARPSFIKEILSQIGTDDFELVMKSKYAKFPQNFSKLNLISQVFEQIILENQCFSIKQLAINGNDLKNLGANGREIGRLLKILLAAVISGQCENTQKELIKYIEGEK